MSESEPVEAGAASEDARPRLSLKKRLAFSLVASVIALLMLELLGRLAGLPSGTLRTLSKAHVSDIETFNSCVGIWRPGFRGRIAWPIDIAYDIEINSLGFRGPDFPREKAAGVTRIYCLGDSTTFSVYVSEDEAWPRVLERSLRRRGLNVEVINGGHPAWSTADELRFFRDRAIELKPDLILHLFCDNDPSGIIDLKGERGEYAKLLEEIHEGMGIADWLRFNTAIGELETRIHLAFKVWRGKQRQMTIRAPEISDEAWKNYEAVYSELAALCREKQIPLVSACFPEITESSEPSRSAERRAAEISRSHSVPWISLSGAFRAAEAKGEKLYWLPVDSHANARGNAIIAAEMERGLESQGLGPFSPSLKRD